ncbi:unnamed protein product [Prunus armeniaca]
MQLGPTRVEARMEVVSPRPARIAARPAKMKLTVLVEVIDQEWGKELRVA